MNDQSTDKAKNIDRARQLMKEESEKLYAEKTRFEEFERELKRREQKLERDTETLTKECKKVEQLERDNAKSSTKLQSERQEFEKDRQRQKELADKLSKERIQIEVQCKKQDERERSLEAREKGLEQREQDRLAGFPALLAEYERSLTKVRKEIEDTRQQALAQAADHRRILLTQTQGDLESHEGLNSELSNKHRKTIEELHKKQQELLNEHYQTLVNSTTRHMSRLQAEQEQRLAQIDDMGKQLDARKLQLQARELDLGDALARLELERNDLETREGLLDHDRGRIDQLVNDRWYTVAERYQARISTGETHLAEVRDDLEAARRRLLDHDTLRHQLGDREPSEILREIRTLRADNQRHLDELSNRLLPEEAEELRRHAARAEETRSELEEERRAHHLLRQQHERQESFLHDLEMERERARRFEGLAETYRASSDMLKDEINKIKNVFERDIVRDERVKALERAVLTRPDEVSEIEDESTWLHNLHDKIKRAQFDFPRRLLWSFHTALKSAEASPLTVLAGVSGTGKSKLPELYGRFGGIPFLSVPVDPSWDSPQSLLGYFNAVDNQFDATDILCALVQSQHAITDRAGLRDAMVMVLLDEMNLAHVELYFSDMLSKLEERRGKERVDLSVSLGAGVDPLMLELGRNVLWLGTMNEDETTTSLSDKVIDRGNILHFPRPRTFARSQHMLLDEHTAPLLPRKTWNAWSRPVRTFEDDEIQEFKSLLEEINRHMGEAGRALGHRVWQSVERYMGNHPDVRLKLAAVDEAQNGEKDAARQQLRDAMKIAFEDQLVLKVMPKLRGIDTSGSARSNCLDRIAHSLSRDGIAMGLSKDYERALRVGHGVFVWHTAEYLLEDGVTHG